MDFNLSTIRADVQAGQHSLSGRGRNVIGNPLHAVSWLVEQLSRQNNRIEQAQRILSGTMTAHTPVHPGDRVRVNMRWQ